MAASKRRGKVRCSLTTLGAFRVSFEGVALAAPPTQKARALLAYLAWHQGTDLARERVAECFWPGIDPERSRSNLNTALWSIRRSLRDGGVDPEAALSANKRTLNWHAETELDVREFFALAASADIEGMRRATALYGGDFLEGDYDEWSVAQRERAGAAYETLLAKFVDRESDVESALLLIERGVLDETPYALVARAELLDGNQAAAATAVKRCRAALAEAGVQPTPAFETEFASLSGSAPREARVAGLPFCGRDAELQTIADAFDALLAGRSRALIVAGAAGGGKSALLERAERLARDRSLRVVGAGAMADDARPFGPWGDLYEALTATPLAQAIARGGTVETMAREIVRALGAPAVVLVDDAHYLGAGGIEMLGAIAAEAGGGVALVAAVRPEGLRGVSAAMPRAAAIDVGALSFEQLLDAVARVAAGQAETVARHLFERSGGNAFFATELFESLVQSGSVRVSHGSWAIDRPLEAAGQTPLTVRAFVENRLYAKGNHAATVACALALEPMARSEDLVAACDLGESQTLDALDDLLALGLIEQPSSGPEFRFHHDLIREVAAGALNVGRRVRLHRAFAQRFAGDAECEPMVRRAHHLRWSGDLPAAARAYVDAAWGVLDVNAWQYALELADAGMECARAMRPKPETHALLARLNEIAAKASSELGDADRVRAHVDAFLLHARESRDPTVTCNALSERAAFLSDELADLERAMIDAGEAVTIARRLGDDALLSRVLFRSSFCAQLTGQRERAVDDAREAAQAALRYGVAETIASSHARLLTVLAVDERYEEAIEAAERALAAAGLAGARTEASARISIAGLWYLLDRFDEERAELEIAAGILAAADTSTLSTTIRGEPLSLMRYRFRVHQATLALVFGRWEEALDLVDVMLAGQVARSFEKRRGMVELLAVDALLGRGGSGDAERAWRIAVAAPHIETANGLVGMSRCRDLAMACAAARLGRPDASQLIGVAAASLEYERSRAPLDADRAYGRLAAAAADIGERTREEEFRARAAQFHRSRAGAAGAAWGGGKPIAAATATKRRSKSPS